MVVHRPDKLQAKRMGEILDQVFYYDGKALTLFNPLEKVYSTQPAPATIEQALDFARESLGLVVPVADLVYRNAYSLLMKEVIFAAVIGDTMINGVEYYYCGENYYRTAYQGNNLVYVTANP